LGRGKNDKQFKKIKIQIKNAPVLVAVNITYSLYEMVDKRELQSVSIDKVRKSENSIEVIIGLGISFAIGYIAGKVVDIPYNYAVDKILSILRKWKRRQKRGTLDIFMDDEPIE